MNSSDRQVSTEVHSHGTNAEADSLCANTAADAPIRQPLKSLFADLICVDGADIARNGEFPFGDQPGGCQPVKKVPGGIDGHIEGGSEGVGVDASEAGDMNEGRGIVDLEHWTDPQTARYRPGWCKRLGFWLIGIGGFYCRPTLIRRAFCRGLIHAGYFIAGFKFKPLIFHR
jgi:hypothetical protein